MARSRKKDEGDAEALDFMEVWSALGLSDHVEPTRQMKKPFWRQDWFRGTATTLLILLPLFGYLAYDFATKTHRDVAIATGPVGGRHELIEASIAERILSKNVGVKPEVRTSGSLENVLRMQAGDVDFALYQCGTAHLLCEAEFYDLDENGDRKLTTDEFPGYWQHVKADMLRDLNADEDKNSLTVDEFRSLPDVRFVANLFSEVVHVIVRQDAAITREKDFDNRVIAVGAKTSGNYAMSDVVLKHFAVTNAELVHCSYDEIQKGLTTDDPDARIDAAILTTGIGADHIASIMATGKCELFPIDRAESLSMRHVFVTPATIPVGVYHCPDRSLHLPTEAVPTVSVQAQLLVREDVGFHVVGQVASGVLSDKFLKRNELYELYRLEPARRRAAARSKPDFEIHLGAGSFYDPHEFDAGEFEGWEALYSLIASSVIASYFLGRWLIRRRERVRGHRLDVYLNRLLRIEMKQAGLDAHPDSDDSNQLQVLLNEITGLRQQALGEFSAHELNEDPAQYCFLEMCHYISEKINAKLLRQRLDRRFRELGDSIQPRVQELRNEEVE